MKITPVILSGGIGTRLWPLSRQSYPKQFLQIFDEFSLFQHTCNRVNNSLFAPAVILGNYTHRFLIQEQLEELAVAQSKIILEPTARNTAPAALISAFWAIERDEDALLLLLPSDHHITDPAAFNETIKKGIPAAQAGAIVAFGIRPDSPHTGYGYIKIKQTTGSLLDVERFVEKPDRETALSYLEDGKHLWNSGIFLMSVTTLIANFERHAPDLLEPCRRALGDARTDLEFLVLDEQAYQACRSISLDHAIMEKSENITCVGFDLDWSDMGSWAAMAELMEKKPNGNAARGNVVLNETENCLVYSDGPLVAVCGIENAVVVATGDSVLVIAKDKVESVKQVVDHIKNNGGSQINNHNRVYRPWGWFECLSEGDRFQVKSLMVKPGKKLSLQKHAHRSEHWVVVKGSVEVTLEEKISVLSENQSTFIPRGSVHRLHNPGRFPAYLIEVQSGDYLGEDDIERIEDDFNRLDVEEIEYC